MKDASSLGYPAQSAPEHTHHAHSEEEEHDHGGASHQHAHGHEEHDHNHNHFSAALAGGKLGLAFKLGLLLTAGFVVIEFVAGLLANSLALISDAGHNLTDALALGFSWWALQMARRAPNSIKTYGYHRAGILAATLNAASLVLIAGYIFFEGVQRLLNPAPVEGWTVTAVAGVALLVNLSVAWLLMRWSKEDLNTRSAFIHIATDAVASLGVIIAGLVEVFTGWRQADPLISILIGVLILWSSWGIIKESANILLEGIPEGLDMVALLRDLLRQPRVSDVHDLHVWTIGTGFRALSCHIKVEDTISLQEANQTVQTINSMLENQYNIRHATVQIECQGCDIRDNIYCANPPEAYS